MKKLLNIRKINNNIKFEPEGIPEAFKLVSVKNIVIESKRQENLKLKKIDNAR